MKPTQEQHAILDARGRVLLINARAGTGKTTTLRMIASAHPEEKILYLGLQPEGQRGSGRPVPEECGGADGPFP